MKRHPIRESEAGLEQVQRSRQRNPVHESEAGGEQVHFGFRLQCSRDRQGTFRTLSGDFFNNLQDKLRTKLTAELHIVAENFSCSNNLIEIRNAGHEVFIEADGDELPHKTTLHIDILVRTVNSGLAVQFVKLHIIEEIKSLFQSEEDYVFRKLSLDLGIFHKACVKQMISHKLRRQAVVLVKDLEEIFRKAINVRCKSISPKLWPVEEDVLGGIATHTWPEMRNDEGQILLPCTHESVYELLKLADHDAVKWILAETRATHEILHDPTIRVKFHAW